MSFKIYNGLKLNKVKTLAEAFSFIDEIRPLIIEATHQSRAWVVKLVACTIYDLLTVSEIDLFHHEDKDRIPLFTAMNKTMTDDNAKEPDEGIESIGIARVNTTTLVLPFLSTTRANNILIDHPQITPFGYWTTTDKEDGISDTEWQRRGTLWRKLFKTSHRPDQCMFIINIIDPKKLIPSDQFMIDLPSIEEREDAVASHLAFDSLENENATHKDVIKLASEKRKKILPTIRGKLHDITIADLSNTLPTVERNDEH